MLPSQAQPFVTPVSTMDKDPPNTQKATPQIKLIDHVEPEYEIAKDTRLYELLRAQQPCFHADEAKIFGKKTLSLNTEYPSGTQGGTKVQKACMLCYANCFRTGISASLEGIPSMMLGNILQVRPGPVSVVSFNTGLALGCKDKLTKSESDQWNKPLTASYSNRKAAFNFLLKANE